MAVARQLFVEILGWKEDETRHTSGDWGEARFFRPSDGYDKPVHIMDFPGETDDGLLIQLTCPSQSGNSLRITETHLALEVADAFTAACAIWRWADFTRTSCHTEQVSDEKFFVYLPDVLAFSIEFISRPEKKFIP